VQEAETEISAADLKLLLGSLAGAADRVLTVVTAAYNEEAAARHSTTSSSVSHRLKLVERLLTGERLDADELAYDFRANHLGLLASGPGAADALRTLAGALGARLLSVRSSDGVLWAWLGSRDEITPDVAVRSLNAAWPREAILALGEPGKGQGGWQLTHHQARAAFAIARRKPPDPLRYADVALLAAMLRDELLVTSLRQLYLEPLEAERDGGAALRTALNSYFCAERNVASAAAASGVS
jgi:hypothetical protein